jgi:hypothetical protein
MSKSSAGIVVGISGSHHLNVYPFLVGLAGGVTGLPYSHVIVVIVPSTSIVIVYIIDSQLAYNISPSISGNITSSILFHDASSHPDKI